jgi:hypothetical protein
MCLGISDLVHKFIIWKMDIFGDDDDDVQELGDNSVINVFNDIFIFLMKYKSSLKVSTSSSSNDPFIHEVVAVWSVLLAFDTANVDLKVQEAYEAFRKSLIKVKFSVVAVDHIKRSVTSSSSEARKYDIVIDINITANYDSSDYVKSLDGSIGKNAIWIGLKDASTQFPVSDDNSWRLWDKYHSSDTIIILQRSSIRINTRGCIYWTGNEGYNLQQEYDNLDKVVVRISEEERTSLLFSDATHSLALKCLDQYGVCVFPELFDQSAVNLWGDAVRQDMRNALDALTSQGVDIYSSDQQIDNYYELSMREALRVDLRNGKSVKKLSTSSALPQDLRAHPAIRRLISEAMNPVDGEHASGNWGMWNFEGKGPTIPRDQRPVTIGSVGAVISFPGCADQTIHADTAHIYTPYHLPGHYFNLFIPASHSDNLALGQTAFVLSSHRLEKAQAIMVEEGGQDLLESLLIRPHLSVGDALIFDCRILHFGLANQSSMEDPVTKALKPEPRVVIYINHHQPWFQDPKNWNDRNKLFAI